MPRYTYQPVISCPLAGNIRNPTGAQQRPRVRVGGTIPWCGTAPQTRIPQVRDAMVTLCKGKRPAGSPARDSPHLTKTANGIGVARHSIQPRRHPTEPCGTRRVPRPRRRVLSKWDRSPWPIASSRPGAAPQSHAAACRAGPRRRSHRRPAETGALPQVQLQHRQWRCRRRYHNRAPPAPGRQPRRSRRAPAQHHVPLHQRAYRSQPALPTGVDPHTVALLSRTPQATAAATPHRRRVRPKEAVPEVHHIRPRSDAAPGCTPP